ncbi:UNVERIFIED_CONTAM: putative mitochondrial protein [Sesamum latifolium]|uniref:Mitochondrial protein n=1 Tax=Sesamum latifolium TaxID=2727402 RepID=A0AAW2XC89_9LAMI
MSQDGPDLELLKRAWKLMDEEEDGLTIPGGLWQKRRLHLSDGTPDSISAGLLGVMKILLWNYQGRAPLGHSEHFQSSSNSIVRAWFFSLKPNVKLGEWRDLRRSSITTESVWTYFTGIYGHPDAGKCKETWDLLRTLAKIDAFRACLRECGLHDLGYEGNIFTWSNHREAPFTVCARLDRACLKSSQHREERGAFFGLKLPGFPHGIVLILSDMPGITQLICGLKKPWCLKSELAVKICQGGIMMPSGIFASSSNRLMSQFGEELAGKEELLWRQRAKAYWLTEGDRNTGFFHAKASEQKVSKKIFKIRNKNGSIVEGDAGIRRVILEYFKSIFSSSNPSADTMEEVVSSLENRVSEAMNEDLLRRYTSEEIEQTLKQMHPLKSLGPDGMSPIFFHKYWNIVRLDICACVLDFLNNGSLNPTLNFTLVVLIPKCSNPEEMAHFRPISLCNVIYKLTSKMIANRLKPFLASIISPSQSAFVPSRLITDNVLFAYELNHFLRHKTWGRVGHASIKLDINKAYDIVEWYFLDRVMLRLGFHAKFVKLIMTCVSSVAFSFLFNGEKFGFLRPERVLRQGDPLSPYLFLLCAEAFSGLIRQAEMLGHLQGIAVFRHVPHISHLLFADDMLIFCKATPEVFLCVHQILINFEQASGMKINLQKSVVVFSNNVDEEARITLSNLLGIKVMPKHDKYLGLPRVVGRSKK